MPVKPQLDWINNLRILAMLMVVVVHTSSPLLMAYGHVPLANWLWADLYNALARLGVPVFVMITGALLLHREYELGDFLRKRLGRIIVPFLLWSLVYIAYAWYNQDITFGPSAWANTKIVLHLLKYGSYYHLWYIYMLIGLYLLIPVLGKFVRNATETEILYFLLVWFAVMMLSQPYLKRFDPRIDLHNFAGYAGYLVLGHYLSFKQFPLKYNRWFFLLLFLMSVAAITAGTYFACLNNKGLNTLLYEPISPAILILSCSAFMLARLGLFKYPAYIKKTLIFTGSYTFGIYLCHALVLTVLDDPDYHVNINYKLCAPALSIPITALVCFVLSLLLVYIIGKLPLGKWLAG